MYSNKEFFKRLEETYNVSLSILDKAFLRRTLPNLPQHMSEYDVLCRLGYNPDPAGKPEKDACQMLGYEQYCGRVLQAKFIPMFNTKDHKNRIYL